MGGRNIGLWPFAAALKTASVGYDRAGKQGQRASAAGCGRTENINLSAPKFSAAAVQGDKVVNRRATKSPMSNRGNSQFAQVQRLLPFLSTQAQPCSFDRARAAAAAASHRAGAISTSPAAVCGRAEQPVILRFIATGQTARFAVIAIFRSRRNRSSNFVELRPGTCRNDGVGTLPDGRQFTRHTFQSVVVLNPVCAARHRDCGNRELGVCGLANGCLDRVTQHNGNSLHHQRRTLWPDTLLPHWPLFPGDGPCHIVLRDWRHTAREQWLESDRFDNPGRCRWLVLPAGVHLRKIPKGSCWLRITAQFCLGCRPRAGRCCQQPVPMAKR
jgi:hypothetical protein